MSRAIAITAFLLLTFSAAQSVQAQDVDETDNRDDSRQRLDLTLVYIDSVLYESLALDFGYSFNLTDKTVISANLPFLDADLEGSGGSGFGDLTVSFSWAPLTRVEVKPWLPQRFGTGISVTFPTGNENDLRSLGTTVVTPFVGLVIPMNDRFSLLPSVGYMHSMDQIVTGADLRLGMADLGLNWVFSETYWLTLYGAFIHDFETDEHYLNSAASLGALFSDRWGASLDYDNTEYFMPGSFSGLSSSIDGQISLNIHYNF